jgi:hypothetical protein
VNEVFDVMLYLIVVEGHTPADGATMAFLAVHSRLG